MIGSIKPAFSALLFQDCTVYETENKILHVVSSAWISINKYISIDYIEL